MQIECPHCQTLLEIAEPAEPEIVCPSCGGEFSIETEAPEEKLNALRIRQISREHRAEFRTRSYCIIGASASLIATIACVINGITRFPRHRIEAIGFFAAAGLTGWLAIRLFLRTRMLEQQTRGFPLDPPPPPPDFSPLSDGRDLDLKLEQLHRKNGNES